jgi:crossover junction endodeoxyribonuclease RusA
MFDPVVILLPLAPSVNGLFAGIGRRYVSGKYKAWRVHAGYVLNCQRPRKCLGRVALAIEVAEPPTKRATDLSNFLKASEDLLVAHGIIEGDSQHYVREITMQWSDSVDGIKIAIRPWETS